MADKKQDVCPLCGEVFRLKDVLVEFEQWGSESRKAHLNCVLLLSSADGAQKDSPRLRRLK